MGRVRDGNGSGKCGYGVCPPDSVPVSLAFARPTAWLRAEIHAHARARWIPACIGQPVTREEPERMDERTSRGQLQCRLPHR
jgi:hypothetical protein